MENDGPVSAVQIRLAKGEITTTQYKEILSHLMKNVSSFQQTSSLKTLQIRYAKSEVSADQYQESLTNLMKNLYSHPWSPPLHILHNRYAQGEITSEQYEEMFNNLTHEEFSYDKSTPLWLINNRYARGELTTPEYEEILSLFSDYTLHLQQSSMTITEGGIPVSSDSEKKVNNISVSQKSPPPSQNRSTSSLKPASAQHGAASDNSPVQPDVGSSVVSDVLPDQPSEDREEIMVDESPVMGEPLVPVASETLPESGSEALPDSEVLADPIHVEDSQSAREEEIGPDSIAIHETLPVISDDSQTLEKPGVLPRSIDIPDLKPGIASIAGSHQLPSSSSASSSHHGGEALPTEFLYPGGKHNLGMIAEEAGIPSSPEIRVSYSITPVSSSGGRTNTYETVTSSISHTVPESGLSDIVSAIGTSAGEKTNGKNAPNIRQQIKTLIVKGDYDEAIKLAETMIAEDAQDYLPFFYKGMARYYLNIHTEALLDLDHARELCKNKDEIRKIDTIREHILCKQRKTSESGGSAEPEGDGKETEQIATPAESEQKSIPDNLSEILDSLGKNAQELIDKKEFKNANVVLLEFIGQCKDLPLERLQAESVDEIYAAMGYVRYQLKDYSHAKEFFQDALAVNAENEVANQFMKDILIRAARKK